ncbi:MAG: ester cyclase [Acidobacteriaceae bacterium]
MTLMERWFNQVWNEGNEDAIEQMSTPDVVAHGLRDAHGRQIHDVATFKELHRQFNSAFSDIHIEVEKVVTEGDFSVARCSFFGRHTGFAFGRPATGKQVNFTGMCMIRIQDGKIAEWWNELDFLTMFEQLDQPKIADATVN